MDTKLAERGIAQITAMDPSDTGIYCNLNGWVMMANPKVSVRCYKANGTAVDSLYAASFSTTALNACN